MLSLQKEKKKCLKKEENKSTIIWSSEIIINWYLSRLHANTTVDLLETWPLNMPMAVPPWPWDPLSTRVSTMVVISLILSCKNASHAFIVVFKNQQVIKFMSYYWKYGKNEKEPKKKKIEKACFHNQRNVQQK